MMTEEHIKEAISLRFIELIAAVNGYKTSSSYPDYGTDLEIKEVDYRIENGHKRYFETGRELKLQLKATTENSIVYENGIVKYKLSASTYNDLITRRETKNPLILILFILPSDKSDWLHVSENELVTKKCAYWYYPNIIENETTNSATKTIEINHDNLISSEVLSELFEIYS